MLIKKVYFISIIFIFLILTIHLHAQQESTEKERLAILNFSAYNCPQHLAQVLTDMASAKIFETNIFTLIERNQIDAIFKELELQQTGCTEAGCAVEVGQLLLANKIIIGTLHKIDRYVILIKVINVRDGKIEGNYRAEADEESDMEGAVMDIVDRITLVYKTETYFSFSISTGYLKPMGDFSNVTDYGYGVNFNFNVNNFLMKNAVLTLATGFYYFYTAEKSVESIMTVPAFLYFGYIYHLSRYINLTPALGGGYLINMMNFDKDGIDVYGKYEYSRKNYYDKAVSARFDIDFVLFQYLHLFLSPNYIYFFEKSSTGQILGTDIGIRMFF